MSRRRPHRRRPAWEAGDQPILIRVGRRSGTKYQEIQAVGPKDAGRFARLVDEQTRSHRRDPLVISVDGFQPWLGDVLSSCIEDCWNDISNLDREVQYGDTMQFPEKASKRGDFVPWTFIIDHMNVPQVYYWSVDMEPPHWQDKGLPPMDDFRFRTGVWFCARGACRFNPQISVTIIFTKPTEVSDHVVKELMFDYLWRDEEFDQPREDEEGICWTFSRLYWLLTDWQNIISEVNARLDEAEANSHGRHIPVKTRTRLLHIEVDRIYEMKEYLHFHNRSFKKLQKLKDAVPKNEQNDPLWGEMDDALEDLEQFDTSLDGLKERFNNLIELEFNITNAVQSENSAFLSAIATLFLPVSFLASLFGMTTVTWPVVWYLWAAIPIFFASVAFTLLLPWAKKKVQDWLNPLEYTHLHLRPNQFTMLGDELPGGWNSVQPTNDNKLARAKRSGRQSTGNGGSMRAQSRRRSVSRRRDEKDL